MPSTVSNLVRGLVKGFRNLFHTPGTGKGMGWLNVKKLKHYSTGPERVYAYRDTPIHYVNPYDLYLAFDEIFVQEIYQCSLPENATILDCGANIGLATLYFKQHYPSARIIAFEPDDKNFALLEKNVKQWGFSGIELRKEAVWKEDTVLHFSSTGDMASKISDAGGGIKVKATRLKDHLQEKIHFLKIDIEGAEYEVLLDISESLHHVENMFFEYHGKFEDTGKLSQVFSILHEAGFQYYIKEAASLYERPFHITQRSVNFDVQLNIFCFRNTK